MRRVLTEGLFGPDTERYELRLSFRGWWCWRLERRSIFQGLLNPSLPVVDISNYTLVQRQLACLLLFLYPSQILHDVQFELAVTDISKVPVSLNSTVTHLADDGRSLALHRGGCLFERNPSIVVMLRHQHLLSVDHEFPLSPIVYKFPLDDVARQT
ncbi:hypothetical protein GQ56_0126450 [Burkholderia paludis]|nr:hypothetical protein GQ56_0126450 [Burkholderia paludis]